MSAIRLAADIGGTFTDVVLETPARRFTTKVLTTPRAPELGVMQGIEVLLEEAKVAPGQVANFIHGTTLATNALIERKGAKTAFVTTEGFRDILEMGYEKRFEQYDVFMDKPPPLVDRPLRFTVPERLSANGKVLVALDEAAVKRVAAEVKATGAQAVAIGFMHAYAHGAHERRAREILQAELPDVTICISSEVCPEMREYERFSTTTANAYVRPLMSGYLWRLRKLLDDRGMSCPLFLMMSGGGLTTLENAARFPIRLVESGPAGGAILAARVASECGLEHVLCYDMGGTTAKICLIDDGEPERARLFEVARIYRDMKGSGLPVRIPVIEMVEIGAGGGSIARVDAMNRVTVGPDSAGSEPGPACYGRGGTLPTVTDANVALGRIDPAKFAAGKIPLAPEKAQGALDAHVGSKLGLKDHWPAAAVAEIVEENMANAARVHAIERGRVISRYTMVAFGGAAPLHAGRLAQKLGVKRVVVPKGAGVGSAIGFLRAPISYEMVRSARAAFGSIDLGAVNALLDGMRREAVEVISAAIAVDQLREQRIVDLRYLGQGHELRVEVPNRALTRRDLDDLRQRFEAQYLGIYGVTLPDLDIEVVTWSVTMSGAADPVVAAGAVKARPAPKAIGQRDVYEPALGKVVPMPVYWRFDMVPGATIAGPAVITEDETTSIVPAAFTATLNDLGYIVMDEKGEQA
jgi:N-methylhydantoinase A